jgi:hypothetical protein
MLPWPKDGARLARVAGAHVVLVDGLLAAYLSRDEGELHPFLPEIEPSRSVIGSAAARALAAWALHAGRPSIGWSPDVEVPAARGAMAPFLVVAGFEAFGPGFRLRSSESLSGGTPAAPPRPVSLGPWPQTADRSAEDPPADPWEQA